MLAVLEEMNDTMRAELDNIERLIKRRVAIGSKVSEKKLIEGLARSVRTIDRCTVYRCAYDILGHSRCTLQFEVDQKSIRRAVQILVQREELEYRSQRKFLYRKH